MTVEKALIVLDAVLTQERLNNVQELVFRQTWEGRTYREIAANTDYDTEYIKLVGFQLWQLLSRVFGEKVTKSNVKSVLNQYSRRVVAGESHSAMRCGNSRSLKNIAPNPKANRGNSNQDWGQAIDVSVFYGRSAEILQLEQWIVQERCRLVTLLGMGGIGKTSLSIKLAEQIQGHFEYVIWRSLTNTSPILDFLAELIQFLSKGQETNQPETVDARISQLMNYLRQHRCLLVLDNAESILRSGDRMGSYREGYEGYGQLFRCVAETPHQSAIVLTSREKPKQLAKREGETLPVRSLQLMGLPTAEAQKVFYSIGAFHGSKSEWELLILHYGGNPLALKMVAPNLLDFFNGKVSKLLEFLKRSPVVFDDIRILLEQQFNRLTDLEKEVMYWLAINRELATIQELQEYLVTETSQGKLLETLACLLRRSLIEKTTLLEKNSASFMQQPFVREYITQQLIEQVSEEIFPMGFALFKNHVLTKASAKNYASNPQFQLILQPLVEQQFFGLISNGKSSVLEALSPCSCQKALAQAASAFGSDSRID